MARITLRRAGILAFVCIAGLLPQAGRSQASAPERLILAPSLHTTFRVQAVYPNTGVTCEAKRIKDLRARYRGRLEIVRQSDGGLALIDQLTFDEYLAGLAEMPRSWPIEALKSQVVAARTYAIAQLTHPRPSAKTLGYDICSTDQCQVYRGLTVEQGAFGEAWVRAVQSTRGKILEYHHRPIQAYYFSTSSGRTKRSFPGGSALPYLRSVDGQDGDSPLAQWTARVPLADLGPILAAAGDWQGDAITGALLSGDTVRLAGAGRSTTIAKRSFRNNLNNEAACVYPDRYPGKDGSNKLPQTVPSVDFTMATSGSDLVLRGRGWGHGVGMSQYGARSLAERGRSYGDILAYYYAGLRPTTTTEPGAIRVLIAENASLIRIGVEGGATISTATGSALAPGNRFEVRGGESLDVRRGVGPSLAPVLTATLDTAAPIRIPPDGTIALSYTLSGAARVSLAVRRNGAEVFRTPEVSQISGPNLFSLSLDTSRAPGSPTETASASPSATASASPGTAVPAAAVAPTPLSPGPYELTLEAYDGLDRVRTAPVSLTVQAPPTPATPKTTSGGLPAWAIALVMVGIIGAGIAIMANRRSRRTV